MVWKAEKGKNIIQMVNKFEGFYLNGIKNGKGKEYNDKGKLIFEGEYLNGKRNGEGKEYFSNYSIAFEGKYLNNKKWTGKGYDKNGNILYNLNNGNGKIKILDYSNFKIIFICEYLN